ncbi:hypothetical protein C8R46DRAFT_1235240 [Mycena filopes]|nr:hypothetical protein C8R46DRAFT_1235240 [Mycena filopes]
MSFLLKKWANSTQQRPSANSKRVVARDISPGPERGLAIIPNELIPTVLARLDGRSLFHIALVSRRFNELSTRAWLERHGIKPSQLSSRHAVIHSDFPAEAFAALRCALFLRAQPLAGLTCTMTSAVDSKDILQLASLLTWFNPRLATTELDFGRDMIPQSTTKPIARALNSLLCAVAADSPTTVFVLKDGLFTCRPDALRRWSPATGHYEGGRSESTYSTVRMHDGSRQSVPTIRSLHTLSIKSPLDASASADSPFDKWKLVVVDSASLTDLQLSIKLSTPEWTAILSALSLPALACLGLWAEAITTATSTRFLNRHPKIRTIKYMSPTADALPAGCAPLRLPALETLNTLVPYLVHILAVPDDAASCAEDDASPSDALVAPQRFPRLVHIELRPHARLHEALLLASAHAPLRALTLWSLAPAHLTPAWPVFPRVRRLTLNESALARLVAAGLPALLAQSFAALTKVEANFSWGNNADISRRQVEKEERAFVERVGEANPEVRTFLFDGKEHSAS